jgi:NADH-quinone oxidoreductase subunit N
MTGNVVAMRRIILRGCLLIQALPAGYILVALVAANEIGTSGLLYYLLAYTFMNIGAFGVVIFLSRKEDPAVNLSDYSGIGFKYPVLAVCMTIFMVSLSGIPPTAGFVGKFYILALLLSQVISGCSDRCLNSAVSVFYYFRIIVYMYERTGEYSDLIISPSLLQQSSAAPGVF